MRMPRISKTAEWPVVEPYLQERTKKKRIMQ
jgi:hypothetical protein